MFNLNTGCTNSDNNHVLFIFLGLCQGNLSPLKFTKKPKLLFPFCFFKSKNVSPHQLNSKNNGAALLFKTIFKATKLFPVLCCYGW